MSKEVKAKDPSRKTSTAAKPAGKVPRKRGRPTASVINETEIFALAFRTFAQQGYEGTTIRELSKQLGVSHNLLNIRYISKAHFWRRVVDAEVARIQVPIAEIYDVQGLDDEMRLRELIRRFCQWSAENSEWAGLMMNECRRASWRLDYIVNSYSLAFQEKLEALLDSVGKTRRIRAITASALSALLVEGIGFYFASAPLLRSLGRSDELSPDRFVTQINLFVDFMMAGLLLFPEGE